MPLDGPQTPPNGHEAHRWYKTSDYNGWTNWDTWHAGLMQDNDQDSYNAVRAFAEKGDREGYIQWMIENIIGPHNKQAIEDAREWNDVPEEERVDHSWEDFNEKHPDASDGIKGLLGGPDVGDTEPTLMDESLINWDELWGHLTDESGEEAEYERDIQEKQDMGIGWPTNHDLAHNQMVDAFYRHHGAIPDEELTPQPGERSTWNHPQAYHNIRVNIPFEHVKAGAGGYRWPDDFVDHTTRGKMWNLFGKDYEEHPDAWNTPEAQRLLQEDERASEIMTNGYTTTLSDHTHNVMGDISHGRPNPYIPTMLEALRNRGYSEQQIADMTKQRWRWNPDTQEHIDLTKDYDAAPPIDKSLDQPGELTLPDEWTKQSALEESEQWFDAGSDTRFRVPMQSPDAGEETGGDYWVLVGDKVAFGEVKRLDDLAYKLAQDANLPNHTALRIRHKQMLGQIEQSTNHAYGEMRNGYPVIHATNVDRNWVYDRVMERQDHRTASIDPRDFEMAEEHRNWQGNSSFIHVPELGKTFWGTDHPELWWGELPVELGIKTPEEMSDLEHRYFENDDNSAYLEWRDMQEGHEHRIVPGFMSKGGQPMFWTDTQPVDLGKLDPAKREEYRKAVRRDYRGTLSKVARYVDVQLSNAIHDGGFFGFQGNWDTDVYPQDHLMFESEAARPLHDPEPWSGQQQINARVDGKIVGSIDFSVSDTRVQITGVWVDPEYRDTNVFMALVGPLMKMDKGIQGYAANPKLREMADKWRTRGRPIYDDSTMKDDGQIRAHTAKKPKAPGAAAALPVNDRGQIGLVRSRGGQHWVLPKGGISRKEAPHETAAREAMEEAGFRGYIDETPLGVFDWKGHRGDHQVQVHRLDVNHIEEPGEDREVYWATPYEAEYMVHPNIQPFVRMASEGWYPDWEGPEEDPYALPRERAIEWLEGGVPYRTVRSHLVQIFMGKPYVLDNEDALLAADTVLTDVTTEQHWEGQDQGLLNESVDQDAANMLWPDTFPEKWTAAWSPNADGIIQVGDRVVLPTGTEGTVIEVDQPREWEAEPEICAFCDAPTEGNLSVSGRCHSCGNDPGGEYDPTIWTRVKYDDGQVVQVADSALQFVQGLEGAMAPETFPEKWAAVEDEGYLREDPIRYQYVPLTPQELASSVRSGDFTSNKENLNLRAKRSGKPGRVNAAQLKAIHDRYQGRCAYCGTPFGEPPNDHLTFDHVVPLAEGGDNLIENILPCHHKCNQALNEWQMNINPQQHDPNKAWPKQMDSWHGWRGQHPEEIHGWHSSRVGKAGPLPWHKDIPRAVNGVTQQIARDRARALAEEQEDRMHPWWTENKYNSRTPEELADPQGYQTWFDSIFSGFNHADDPDDVTTWRNPYEHWVDPDDTDMDDPLAMDSMEKGKMDWELSQETMPEKPTLVDKAQGLTQALQRLPWANVPPNVSVAIYEAYNDLIGVNSQRGIQRLLQAGLTEDDAYRIQGEVVQAAQASNWTA